MKVLLVVAVVREYRKIVTPVCSGQTCKEPRWTSPSPALYSNSRHEIKAATVAILPSNRAKSS